MICLARQMARSSPSKTPLEAVASCILLNCGNSVSRVAPESPHRRLNGAFAIRPWPWNRRIAALWALAFVLGILSTPVPSAVSPTALSDGVTLTTVRIRTCSEATHAIEDRQQGPPGPTRPIAILSLAWSPDGATLAAAGTDALVYVLPGVDGTCRVALTGHTGTIRGIAWSPNGLLLATAATDRTVRIWDIATDNLVRVIRSPDRREGSWAIAWSPSDLLASASENAGVVRIWRADGSLAQTLTGHSLDVKSVAWSPDATLLASASFDRTVRIWRSRDGALLRVLRWRSSNNANVLAWRPDGQVLATGDYGGTVRLWRLSDGALIQTLEGGIYTMNGIAWSPDGKSLAGASYAKDVHVWQVESGAVRLLHGHQGPVFSVAWSPDGQTLVSGGADGTVRQWDMTRVT
jgi:WD40 repeat protein